MKTITLLLTLSMITFATILRADDDTPLEKQMQILARGMRQLSQQIANSAKLQENILLLETMKRATGESKTMDPKKTREIAQNDRAAFLADYRTDLDELKDVFDQIENALKAAQFDKATSLLATVHSIKKEGHGKFKAD